MDSSSGSPLASVSFRTSDFAPAEQFESWREAMSFMSQVERSEGEATAPFKAESSAFHLGTLVVGTTAFEGQRFIRDSRRIRRDLLDHVLVQYYRKGSFGGETEEREVQVRSGDICVIDLASASNFLETDSSGIHVMMPRDFLAEAMPVGAGLNGIVLRDASAGLLRDFLISLAAAAPSLSRDQAPNVERAMRDLFAACLAPSGDRVASARPQMERLLVNRIRAYVDSNLACNDLGAEKLCGTFGISRSKLYRLFEPLGGVSHFIRGRRLLAVYRELRNPSQRSGLAALAERWDFDSQASLSRAFRRHFGITPSQAREGAVPNRALGKDLDSWIRGLAH
ncbi:MAG TPA: helix-turn-helix domain-containing protein [Devosiaceae bacterium]|jgi:AraC-like DNA-binding protein|nr:helix-turn-helix domain-containing protein [Devosiaceae bacterium]